MKVYIVKIPTTTKELQTIQSLEPGQYFEIPTGKSEQNPFLGRKTAKGVINISGMFYHEDFRSDPCCYPVNEDDITMTVTFKSS